MQLISNMGIIAKSIWRGMAPKNAAMLQIPLNFATDVNQSLTLDLSTHSRNKWGIAGIQSVKIDNSLNAGILTITFDNGDVIYVPPYSQGIFPVLYSGESLSFVANCALGSTAKLSFLNTREQAQIWAANYALAGTVNVSGSSVYSLPTVGTFTDGSAALAVANTAQLLFAANPARKFLTIRNPATATSQNIAAPEPCYLSFTTTTPTVGGLGTWELLPGEQVPEWWLTSTEAIYWIAATANHRLTAKYM